MKCISLNIIDDDAAEQKEFFTLDISGEPGHVVVVQRALFITINYDTNDGNL